jgi:ABC-2 type transport system permease protein
MSVPLLIAREEWRFWIRSRLAVAATVLALLLVVVSLVTTMSRLASEREARSSLQTTAEETFRAQPGRHPHRMVHYGHYVFRTPAPLAVVDPGVDPYTGTVLFLEGHRQNLATFSPLYSGAQGGPFAQVTPALVYQVLVPLLLVVVGYASVAREREARTDRQLFTSALRPADLWLGKVIALAGLAGVLLVPLALAAFGVLAAGENPLAAALLVAGYALYLLVWCLIIVAASARAAAPSGALLVLVSAWVGLSILAPRAASSLTESVHPMASKIESDLELTVALRDAGDGHNASDPAFARLRANLFEEYGVDRVEDLPVNFRGIVAQKAEADLTDAMNRFAEARMEKERRQASTLGLLSVTSPALAIRKLSTAVAGTDLAHHHRFLREAEAARFDFVQGLNKLHAEELAYADDINRSSDPEAERRTRVSAENWRLLDDFTFTPAPAGRRFLRAFWPLSVLLLWAAGAAWLGLRAVRQAAENLDG